MTLTPGTKLDGFEILGPLGAGGMGEVYRARDATLKREVAIKVLPVYFSQDPDRLRRFEQEAQAAAALNHPNILSVHRFGTFEGAPYLVSELLDGGTLGQLLTRGPLPVRKAIDFGAQIARGLAAAHEKGIVHRDLKPENIFVTKDGRAKILDFGLAKLTESQLAASDGQTVTLTEHTEPGVVMGTVGYMSPEQVRGETADHRADIFAFGAILYEMLTGRRAFRKATSPETMAAILNEDPPSISQIATDTPMGLLRIVHRCLEKNPEQRFHSASDLAFALEALSDSSAIPSSNIENGPRAPSRSWLWIAVTAAVLALIGIVTALTRNSWWPHTSHQLTPQRITANPADTPVTGAAISPDGKYVAYSDPTGVYLRQIDSGETTPLVLPKGFDGILSSWFPDSTHLLLYNREGMKNTARIWKVSILGGDPKMLLEDAEQGSVSPDGSQMTFFRGNEFERGLWLADADGQNPHRLMAHVPEDSGKITTVTSAAWSPDGRRIAYVERQSVSSTSPNGDEHFLYTRKADGSDPKLVLHDNGLGSVLFGSGQVLPPPLCWVPDGRLYFAPLPESRARIQDRSIWSIAVDQVSGKLLRQPQELLKSLGWIGGLSVSGDGKRLVFWRSDVSRQTFISEVDFNTRKMSVPRRLTLDQSVSSVPVDWTANSKAVVFVSRRNGKYGIYKQGLDETTPKVLLQKEPAGSAVPRLSGDGSEVLYTESERPNDPDAPVRLLAVPITGGTSRLILSEPGINNFLCAKPPSRVCIFNEWFAQTDSFYLLDLNRGKGRLVTKVPNHAEWGLSPDGSTLALVINGEKGQVRFLDINSEITKDVTLRDWPILKSADWSADSKMVLSVSVSPNGVPVLLGIDREGNAKVLLEGNRSNPFAWIIPSPDGKYGALGVNTGESNVWMVENY